MPRHVCEVPLQLKDRALSATAEGITISDPSLPDNPIIYANSGFEQITGYRVDDVVGKNCRFLQGPDTDRSAAETIRRAITDQQPCLVEILNYRKDGSSFWNRLSITPVRDEAGKVTHYIGIQSDITQRRRAEEELEKVNTQLMRSLQVAAGIQQSLLPSVLPEAAGVRFAWRFRPSEELAGDTLNIVRLDDTHIGLYVLDVSGHGVSSALLSFSLSQMLTDNPLNSCLFAPNKTDESYSICTPAEVLERLNMKFPIDYRTGQFFTILYGILDTESDAFTFAGAGHPGPVLMRHTLRPMVLPVRSFPIGLSPTPGYTEQTITLRPGDRLLMYTDGVTEALNPRDLPYGEPRFLRDTRRSQQMPLDQAMDHIVGAIDRWACHIHLRDDLSLVGLEIEPTPLMYHV